MRVLIAAVGKPAASATTGDDGRFSLSISRAGVYRFEARDGEGARVLRIVTLHVAGECARVDLSLPVGPREVRGVAVHVDGRPFAGRIGALLLSATYDLYPVVGVETLPDGGFVLPCGHASEVTLFAAAAGFSRRGATIRLPSEEEIRFVVDEGGIPVIGRVVADEDGRPIAGAEIRVEGVGARSGVAHSDAEGRFRIPTAGKLTLVVKAPGFAESRGKWLAAKDSAEVEIRLSRARRVAGRVVGTDGAPVAGAQVVARSRDGVSSPVRTASRADGSFGFAALPPGDHAVYVHDEAFVSGRLAAAGGVSGLIVSCREGDVTDLTLRVVPAARAVGRVIDGDGNGVPGIHVRVHDTTDGRGRNGWLPDASVATDGSGRFACGGLAPGVTYRAVALPDTRREMPSGVRLARVDRPIEFEFTMPPSRTLVVTVEEEDTGKPIPGARVRLLVKRERGWRRLEDTWTTTGDGTATLDDLPAGMLKVSASHREFLSSTSSTEVAGSGGDAKRLAVTVTLRPGVPVTGRVLEPDGTPVPRAAIYWTRISTGEARPSRRRVIADTNGDFSARFVAGRYRVRVSPIWPMDPVAPASGEEVEIVGGEIVLVLPEPLPPRETGTMVFRVVDAGGHPVPYGRARIERLRASTMRGGERTFAGGRLEVDTADYDAVRIEVVEAWRAPGRPLEHAATGIGPIPLAPGEVEIRLPLGGTIHGTVVGADGAPEAGLVVRAVPASANASRFRSGLKATAVTDPRGAFVLRGIGDGEYEVGVEAPSDRKAPPPVRARAGATDIRIVLAAVTAVTIEVVDPEGRAVIGADVYVWSPSISRHVASGRTGVDGLARLVGLDPDAELQLRVAAGAREDLTDWIRAGWRPRDERVALFPVRSIRGVVLEVDGRTVPRARVRWRGPDGRHGGSTTADEAGRFMFENAVPGRLRLTAFPPAAWPDEWDPPEVVAAPGEQEVVLRLGPVGVIRVQVVTPVEGESYVHLAGEPIAGERPAWTRELVDGATTFGGLVPGNRYEIMVAPTEAGLTAHREDVTPGTSVRLTLAPGQSITGSLGLPEGAENPYVWADRPGFSIRGTVTDDRYEVRGLLAGEWTLRAGAACLGRYTSVKVRATAGTTCDVVVPAN